MKSGEYEMNDDVVTRDVESEKYMYKSGRQNASIEGVGVPLLN